jgi:signal peptidase I
MPVRETFLRHCPAIALLLVLACGCQQPKQIDCLIVGHSMAPTFKSEHGLATCDECGLKFACDGVSGDDKRISAAVCGNCGRQNLEKIVTRPADQVKLNVGQSVGRWDVVAFRRGDRVLVKRVIGLPGETIDFRNGNLIVDGRIALKQEEVRKEVSTCVFDSKPSDALHRSFDLMERIIPREEDAWGFSRGAIVHKCGSAGESDKAGAMFDFLDYRHRRCYKHSGDRAAPVEIDDSNPFNQSVRRSTNQVDELDVRVELTFSQKGTVRIERTTTKGNIGARIELSDDQTMALTLTRKFGESVESVERDGVKVDAGHLTVSLVNYDNLIHLLVNKIDGTNEIRLKLSDELPKNAEPMKIELSKPVVSVGVSREDSITIKRFSIWRDWYLYQYAPKPNMKLPIRNSERGYYVVGDNLPVSEDSRHFGSVEDVIGVVQPIDFKRQPRSSP